MDVRTAFNDEESHGSDELDFREEAHAFVNRHKIDEITHLLILIDLATQIMLGHLLHLINADANLLWLPVRGWFLYIEYLVEGSLDLTTSEAW